MFDEPSSYLDVKQRLTAAHMIRELMEGREGDRRYVLVVEHDLAVLDYLSDYVCVLYGAPGGYGVVTMPFSVRQGINAFLAGFIPTENLRFRDDALTFKVCCHHLEAIRISISLLSTHHCFLMLSLKGIGACRGKGCQDGRCHEAIRVS